MSKSKSSYCFCPGAYIDANSKLEVVIRKSNLVLLCGYYDFIKEGFYIVKISKKAHFQSIVRFLNMSLDRFGWEYSHNYDDKLYQEWLKEHVIFNRL